MLKFKIKGKKLDDSEEVEPYFLGWYDTEFSCRSAAFELSKTHYNTICYKQDSNGVFYSFKEFKARVN